MAHAQMFDPDDPQLARLRGIALSLPEAQEKVSHALLVLLDPMDAEVMLERPDSFVPMYLGPSGWIGLELEDLDEEDLRDLLADSYRNTAPARLVRELPAETPPPDAPISFEA